MLLNDDRIHDTMAKSRTAEVRVRGEERGLDQRRVRDRVGHLAALGFAATGFATSDFFFGTAATVFGAATAVMAAWAEVTGRCSSSSFPDSAETWCLEEQGM